MWSEFTWNVIVIQPQNFVFQPLYVFCDYCHSFVICAIFRGYLAFSWTDVIIFLHSVFFNFPVIIIIIVVFDVTHCYYYFLLLLITDRICLNGSSAGIDCTHRLIFRLTPKSRPNNLYMWLRCPSVRKKVFPIPMKFGMLVEVDEWCMTVCRMTRSKVKVTRSLMFEILRFSKSISSAIFNVSWQMTTCFWNYGTISNFCTEQIFDICPSFFCHMTSNLEGSPFRLHMLLLLQYHSPGGGGVLWPQRSEEATLSSIRD